MYVVLSNWILGSSVQSLLAVDMAKLTLLCFKVCVRMKNVRVM